VQGTHIALAELLNCAQVVLCLGTHAEYVLLLLPTVYYAIANGGA
jgi:hypothetical protein